MVRYRSTLEVRYGHFAEHLEIMEELAKVVKARGLHAPTYLVPTVGRTNQFIIEIDFPDLATFEAENRKFYGDAEIMKLIRRSAELVVQGSTYDELFEPAPHLA